MPPQDRDRIILFRDKSFPLCLSNQEGKFPIYPLKGAKWVCPICGELWGSLEIPAGKSHYHIINWPCENHGSRGIRGGSFFRALSWWPEEFGFKDSPSFRKSLSEEFLTHETLIKINQLLGNAQ